jgi:aminoglycoside phosphotransferase (APT) family kinase protein
MLDQAQTIRKGEEINEEKLSTYLRASWPGFERIRSIQQFPGGYSNLTYLLQTNLGEYVLRRPPFGANIKSAHDMGREFRVLSMLNGVYDKIPMPILHCDDESVIGAPFFIMQRVKGLILRGNLYKKLSVSADDMHAISAASVDNLANLHRIDLAANGLDSFGKPEGYIERQVSGWIKRYQKSETDEVVAMNELIKWMPENQPSTHAAALIHNDYKYDNLVLDTAEPSNILAVLDWEMATVGHPLMDLGTTLAYWTETKEAQLMPLAADNLSWLPGNLNREGFAERYSKQTGDPLDDLLFYYVFGTFKIGVIVQQIYSRYKQGKTQDSRFANLIEAVKYFGRLGTLALDKGRISQLF